MKKFGKFAFWLPFVICIGLLIGNNVYPFGDRCILHVDMYHQYCPFFTEFLNKLQSGGNLMYTWNIGLGSDFMSVYAYYLASPLNWLLLICPRGFVIEFMTLLIVLKISFSGFNFYYFLKEHFGFDQRDSKKALPAVAFGTAYALCGFVAAYSWDIMWMDCIALAPLIFAGLERLYKKKDPTLYFVTLAISIFANYYISMMICMFLVFYFIVLFFENKEGRLQAVGRFTIYSLLAGGCGVVLMLPEMKILSYSGSSGMSFPKTMSWYFNLVAELSRMNTGTSVYTGIDHWPNLFTGAFASLLLGIYILSREIPRSKKIPRVLMLIFFIVSFANNQLDFIWHGLHFPDSLPGRQSFLFSFMLLVMGYEAFVHIKEADIKAIVASDIVAIGLVVASYFYADENITEPISFLITGLFLLAYGIMFILCKIARPAHVEYVRKLVLLVMVVEVTVNMAVTGFSTTSRTDYTAKDADYRALVQMAEEDAGEGTFYRIENTERMTKNDDTRYGFRSGTQFSSLMNINVSHFYQKLYMEGGKNYYCFNGATPLVAGMLSVKYMILDDPNASNDVMTLVGQSGDLYLYRYTYTLPLGFIMDEEAAESYECITTKKIDAINNLGFLNGAARETLVSAQYTQDEQIGETTITVNEEGHFYAYYDMCSSDTLYVEFENGGSWKYGKTTHSYLIDLGYHMQGENIKITNRKSDSIGFSVFKLNLDSVQAAYNTLNKQTMELKTFSDTHITGEIDVTEGGRFILSIPNEEGWKLYVDGELIEKRDFAEAFISTYLEEGHHEIELKYETPGLVKGAICSLGCLVIFLILFFVRRSRLKAKKED